MSLKYSLHDLGMKFHFYKTTANHLISVSYDIFNFSTISKSLELVLIKKCASQIRRTFRAINGAQTAISARLGIDFNCRSIVWRNPV